MAILILKILFAIIIPPRLVQSQALDRFVFSEASCVDLKPCSDLDLEKNEAPYDEDISSRRLGFICGPYKDLVDEFPFHGSSIRLSSKHSFSPGNLHKG